MSNQLPSNTVTLMVFHNDLRVLDNAALSKAAELSSAGRLLLVYAPLLTDGLDLQADYVYDTLGEARQQFMLASVADLNVALVQRGNRLLYLQGDKTTSNTFSQLSTLIERHNVTNICVSNTADYNQNRVYDRLRIQHPQLHWHVEVTASLFDELPLDELPKSFTQFRKKIEANFDLLKAETDRAVSLAPDMLATLPESMLYEDNSRFEVPTIHQRTMDKQPSLETGFEGGETSGLQHLQGYFDSEAPSTYKITRNSLDEWTDSTKFSAWLANGSLSVHMVLNRLRQYERDVVANDSTYWIWFELLWREYFYWYAVTHQQKLFWFKGIGQHTPTTQLNPHRLQQWQNGKTAYPIVNACMHQLNTTGYMSNRGRQLVASCFIHELGLDWRYGAAYFEQQLVDYDVASNWGNWQYLAGVGADPRGSRQFNLDKQTQQYDPNGDFIKRWQPNGL